MHTRNVQQERKTSSLVSLSAVSVGLYIPALCPQTGESGVLAGVNGQLSVNQLEVYTYHQDCLICSGTFWAGSSTLVVFPHTAYPRINETFFSFINLYMYVNVVRIVSISGPNTYLQAGVHIRLSTISLLNFIMLHDLTIVYYSNTPRYRVNGEKP